MIQSHFYENSPCELYSTLIYQRGLWHGIYPQKQGREFILEILEVMNISFGRALHPEGGTPWDVNINDSILVVKFQDKVYLEMFLPSESGITIKIGNRPIQ